MSENKIKNKLRNRYLDLDSENIELDELEIIIDKHVDNYSNNCDTKKDAFIAGAYFMLALLNDDLDDK